MRTLLFVLALLLAAAPVLAQPAPPPEAAVLAAAPVAAPAVDPHAPFSGSFLFSLAEISSIRQAVAGKVMGDGLLKADQATNIPPVRLIKVSGVVYRSQGDWIVWINGQKVLPRQLLPEIVEISVQPDSSVALKWFDIGLNGIINITLRPHQTYDIVTGLLLPG